MAPPLFPFVTGRRRCPLRVRQVARYSSTSLWLAAPSLSTCAQSRKRLCLRRLRMRSFSCLSLRPTQKGARGAPLFPFVTGRRKAPIRRAKSYDLRPKPQAALPAVTLAGEQILTAVTPPTQKGRQRRPCVGRSDRIRTCGIVLPKHARYRTAPHPDYEILVFFCYNGFALPVTVTASRITHNARSRSATAATPYCSLHPTLWALANVPGYATPRFLCHIIIAESKKNCQVREASFWQKDLTRFALYVILNAQF